MDTGCSAGRCESFFKVATMSRTIKKPIEQTFTRDQVAARVREIALSLDALPDADFALLANVLPSTTEAWRKRGTGPSYARIGNAVFYPRAAVAEFLASKTRERSSVMKGSL